jgi:glycosyltransferase involved in cell wall biosynthesis
LGFAVDLITYPFGDPVQVPHVRVVRVPRPWGLRAIKIGPSFAKVALDVLLFVAAWKALHRETYVAVHSHEEAAVFGVGLARRFGIPHLYDMHSSLPEQLRAWRGPGLAIVVASFRALERFAVSRSTLVVGISRTIVEQARRAGARREPVLIENTASISAFVPRLEPQTIRDRYGLGTAPVVLYAGNLEPYQGVSLLIKSLVSLRQAVPEVRLMVVGGDGASIRKHREIAAAAGVADAVVFVGPVPFEALAGYLAVADVLACPRLADAAPMKIYTYLQAHRPIVATDISAHREVLSGDAALLAAPQPRVFAEALERVLTNGSEAARLARGAEAAAASTLGDELYRQRVGAAYSTLLSGAVQARSAE